MQHEFLLVFTYALHIVVLKAVADRQATSQATSHTAYTRSSYKKIITDPSPNQQCQRTYDINA